MGALESFSSHTPFLWFDSNAEEAVKFYLSVFKNSRRLDDLKNSTDNSGPKGKILTIVCGDAMDMGRCGGVRD